MPLFGLLGGWIVLIIKKAIKKLSQRDKDTGKNFSAFIVYGFYSKIFVLILIIVIYILAIVELIKYSQETFNSITIGVVSVVLSSLTIAIAIPSLVCILCKCYFCTDDEDDDDDDDDDSLHACISKPLDYFITVITFMYLGYFFPYMVIAFIENPIQSVFIYAGIFLLVILFYIIQIVWLLRVELLKKDISKKKIVAFYFTVCLGILAFPYFLIVLIALFSLGSFDEFGDLKNIILPLFTSLIVSLMGVVAYYVKNNSTPST